MCLVFFANNNVWKAATTTSLLSSPFFSKLNFVPIFPPKVQSFEIAKEMYFNFRTRPNIKFIFVCTKMDLLASEGSPLQDAKEFAQLEGSELFEISSKENIGIANLVSFIKSCE